MRAVPPFILAVLLAASGLGPAHAQPSWAAPDAPPPRMLPDPGRYCATLSEQVDEEQRAHPAPSPEIHRLAAEGRRMCDVGHYKGGLMRLRYALRLLRGED